ncbi:hypothetical protein JN531_016860 (plasmid) [Flagellatimonas centrodinii]|uniref:hypothetical protein n=1 Tax=Flagellatimonas centrodinii TaxID=2806210 RepID=UPI001FEF1332|nr:hypothetical protein [Flagellatimonas centrodinii]ULQ48449.1 hypothetical protein JN531_016860 [Flagellatimonas centrodinii]
MSANQSIGDNASAGGSARGSPHHHAHLPPGDGAVGGKNVEPLDLITKRILLGSPTGMVNNLSCGWDHICGVIALQDGAGGSRWVFVQAQEESVLCLGNDRSAMHLALVGGKEIRLQLVATRGE